MLGVGIIAYELRRRTVYQNPSSWSLLLHLLHKKATWKNRNFLFEQLAPARTTSSDCCTCCTCCSGTDAQGWSEQCRPEGLGSRQLLYLVRVLEYSPPNILYITTTLLLLFRTVYSHFLQCLERHRSLVLVSRVIPFRVPCSSDEISAGTSPRRLVLFCCGYSFAGA
jgi:hypothetical protein